MANSNGIIYSSVKSPQHPKLYSVVEGVELGRQRNRPLSVLRSKFYNKAFWHSHSKLRNSSFLCRSTETHNKETKECTRSYVDYSEISRLQEENEHLARSPKSTLSSQGLAEACRFAYNDAKFMNERARSDIVLLSRGIMRLDARARQDVAILGTEFLKLDARAREDTEKIDLDVKRRAERLHQITTILKNKAESRLKSVADRHWSDGALEADLRRADYAAKRRAMEDSLMALEFVKNIHDRMVSKTYDLKRETPNAKEISEHITLEKNGISLEFLPGEMSADRINAIKEAYWGIATAVSEADGMDYTDPEELELVVAALIDLDAMDSKSSVSLLAECSSSPDVNTRKALANALSTAPSMWTLGNAGMGALQRLAEDSNLAIAAAASRTIAELKKQWEIEEGDSWRFMVNQNPSDIDSQEDD